MDKQEEGKGTVVIDEKKTILIICIIRKQGWGTKKIIIQRNPPSLYQVAVLGSHGQKLQLAPHARCTSLRSLHRLDPSSSDPL